ncbi:MAG: hypothetical protein WC315_08955 [Candidatus Omnitrophota bacterium]|jgi:hypothetical protein
MVGVVRDPNDSIIIQDLGGRITTWSLGAEKMHRERIFELKKAGDVKKNL